MVLDEGMFSAEDILALGNPRNIFGESLADWMVKMGHIFSDEDVVRLGNPTAVGIRARLV
jgi:hypothetical protein